MAVSRRLVWTHSGHVAPYRADGKLNIRALLPEDFDVVFQPIVDARRGRLFAHEALVRCRHPSYKVPTTLFANAAEQKSCGYLGRIIRQVGFARWDSGPVFVNVHPDELSSRWFVMPDDPIALHPHDVYLEITETGAFSHYDLCMKVLREVCDRTGAHLVVDDFGAGHSNMERVLDLRPKVVKLDASLVRGVDVDPKRRRFVRDLIRLCTDLGAEVVAECVETLDELKAIRDAGAHYVQGYLIARPGYPAPSPLWPFQPSRPPPAPPRHPSRTRPPTAPRKALPPEGPLLARRSGGMR